MKYIVTDPCYIIDDETWSNLCDKADELSNGDRGNLWCTAFDSVVTTELQHMTSPIAKAGQTGYGDWSNHLLGVNIIQSEFCADSGMVCVCPLTDEIHEYLKKKYGENYQSKNFGCVAVFEASNNIVVNIDQTDSQWTVVKIKDLETGFVISSDDGYNDDDDPEYYDDEEDIEEEEY